jgi:hypothetical protein
MYLQNALEALRVARDAYRLMPQNAYAMQCVLCAL